MPVRLFAQDTDMTTTYDTVPLNVETHIVPKTNMVLTGNGVELEVRSPAPRRPPFGRSSRGNGSR